MNKNELRSFTLAAGQDVNVQALQGCFWVTMENDAFDYALEAGQTQRFNGPGLLVIQALDDVSVLQLTQCQVDRTRGASFLGSMEHELQQGDFYNRL
jgi:hypothetical protein